MADHSQDLKLCNSFTGGGNPAELCFRVLVSCMCLQWALRSAQSEAVQLRQSQGSIHGEVMFFQKKGKLCTSPLAMRLWKGWGYLCPSPCSGYPLSSLLWLPMSLPSFYRDIWYSFCPCQCIFLVLFMIFVKLPHRILVYSVRIYERALFAAENLCSVTLW